MGRAATDEPAPGAPRPASMARSGAVTLLLLASLGCSGDGEEAARAPAGSADDDAIVPVVAEEAIPAIERPSFATAVEASEFMRAEEPVVGVVVSGQARAYSLWHLDRREIVNDRAGDTPLVVAWCPIAYTARAFRRELAGRALTFVVSGRLWRNALVMRDRETGSLWSQVNGAAIAGPLQGAELTPLSASVAPWSEWARLHPRTLVLRKPPLDGTLYPGYFEDPERVGLYGQKRRDPRLQPKSRVLGVEEAGRALAVPVEALRERRVWNDQVGGRAVVLVSLGERGPDLAYERSLGSRLLTFVSGPRENTGIDQETGSLWDLVEGRALSGPLEGSRLTPRPALLAYWFIWSAYYPQTEVRQVPPA